MRRLIYLLTRSEAGLKGDIKGFTEVIRKFYSDSVLLSQDDVIVFLAGTNGYLVTGSAYDGSFDFINQYANDYDTFQLVIDKNIFETPDMFRMFYNKLVRFFPVRRQLIVTVTDTSVHTDSASDGFAFVVHPETNDDGTWQFDEACSGDYAVGNLIWHTYAGRHAEIEDMCFSYQRADVFVGQLLARCFNLDEVDSLFSRIEI